REAPAKKRLEFFLADFALELLRALLCFALQVLDLPAHVDELPFLLGVLEPMLLGEALLRLRDEPRAFLAKLPLDVELEILLFPFEVAPALAQRQVPSS